jgi:hypothetical protein
MRGRKPAPRVRRRPAVIAVAGSSARRRGSARHRGRGALAPMPLSRPASMPTSTKRVMCRRYRQPVQAVGVRPAAAPAVLARAVRGG